jgi:hypothetical protein
MNDSTYIQYSCAITNTPKMQGPEEIKLLNDHEVYHNAVIGTYIFEVTLKETADV